MWKIPRNSTLILEVYSKNRQLKNILLNKIFRICDPDLIWKKWQKKDLDPDLDPLWKKDLRSDPFWKIGSRSGSLDPGSVDPKCLAIPLMRNKRMDCSGHCIQIDDSITT